MFTNLNTRIELAANLTIIVVATLFAVVLVKDHFLNREPVAPSQNISQRVEGPNQMSGGTNLSSLGIDWKQNKQTLVLAISSTCHFCTDSATFYQTLIQNKKDTRIVAVLPQTVAEGKSYLQKLGVSVDEVRQLPLDKIGVRGTPTLMLINASGAVADSWIGKLSPDKEADVLKRLQL